MTASAPTVAFAMGQTVFDRMFHEPQLARLARHARILTERPLTEFETPAARAVLGAADYLITGWECPLIDAAVLDAAPRLRAVIHAAGTVKHHLDPVCWERGVLVSSQAGANAVPVAEFTVAMILLSGKKVLPIARALREAHGVVEPQALFPAMGNYGKRVGIIGASKIGRLVIGMLRPFAFEIVVSDPYLTAEDAAGLGVTPVTLEELMATSDIVSLHAPSLHETHHMVDGPLIELLRPGATLINTARGELIDQDALTRRIERGDLYAVLDVTTPWVLAADNPLYDHPNVLLTPHIAGSLGTELERLADSAVDETLRLIAGGELVNPVTATDLSLLA